MKSVVVYNNKTNCIECDNKERIPSICQKYFADESKKCKNHYKNFSNNDNCEKKCPYGFISIKRDNNIFTSLVFKNENEEEIRNKLKYRNEKINNNYIYDREKIEDLIEDINYIMNDYNIMSDCTHDLGNMGTYFNTMSSKVEEKLEDLCESDDDIKALISMYDMVNYRISLMNDLSQIGFRRYEINLHPLLDKLRIMMSYKAKNKSVKIKLDQCDYYIKGFDYLYLAFFIILDNAIKYVPEKGEVKIYSTDCEDCIRVSVENIGPKIDENEKSKLLFRGYRGVRTDNYMGKGIGLSILNDICKKAEIEIEIKNTSLNDNQDYFSINLYLEKII